MTVSDLRDFIRTRVSQDIESGKVDGTIVTRFPPEPNGYLHIGHAKSICLNFGIAEEYGGQTYLRFDDTNPLTESGEYVAAIQLDVQWLGFDWEDRCTFASDYFPQLYSFAEDLVQQGKAFVCDLSATELQATRGTLSKPGQDSPFRARSIEENLDLFRRMKAGEFPNGAKVLRAKIDMQSPNLNLRDPVIYRIVHASHFRTGDAWCVYPMYDFTHCICDALEGITHSLCTLEFEDHRALYDWVLDNININFHPPQIEFSRLNLEHTITSKRVLRNLVEQGYVDGWDDPRMPTLSGMRQRGVPPTSIHEFCRRIGVTKQENLIETELLDFCIRATLENTVRRCMVVQDPLPVEITNFEGHDLMLAARWHPKSEDLGERNIVFGREVFIDRSDFAETASPGFKRLTLGGIVRLRYAFIIQCDEVVKDENGRIVKLKARYFPDSRSGQDSSGLKPKGVIQFVAQSNARPVETRDYEHLFVEKRPSAKDWITSLNSTSRIVHHGLIERAAIETSSKHFQFERLGYYYRETSSESTIRPVFHRTVALQQHWKKK